MAVTRVLVVVPEPSAFARTVRGGAARGRRRAPLTQSVLRTPRGVFQRETATNTGPNTLGPTENQYETLWADALGDDFELDFLFTARGGALPADESAWDAVVVGGSETSANDDGSNDLKAWVGERWTTRSATKLLGVCFGAQLVAVALGGAVDKGPAGKFFGCHPLRFVERKRGIIPALWAHGEVVARMPEGARVLATSDSSEHAVWTLRDDILAVQPHPEGTVDVVSQEWVSNGVKDGLIDAEQAAGARVTLVGRSDDDWAPLRTLVRTFLQGGRVWLT